MSLPATIDFGLLGFVDKGEWSAAKPYERNNVVTHKNAVWNAVSDVSAGIEPGSNPVWHLWLQGNVLASYIGDFRNFYEQIPPEGWAVRNGAILNGVSITYSALLTELQKPANAWKLKTEDEWQALVNAEPFNGEGGAPFFVLDIDADTIRLPDTRNMIMTDAGTLIGVGVSQGDAQQRVTGSFAFVARGTSGSANLQAASASGSFYADTPATGQIMQTIGVQDVTASVVRIDSSQQVRIAAENRAKRFGGLGCVYIGGN